MCPRRSFSPRGMARLMVGLIVLAPIALAASPAYAGDAANIPINAARILEYHNAERTARGVAPPAAVEPAIVAPGLGRFRQARPVAGASWGKNKRRPCRHSSELGRVR